MNEQSNNTGFPALDSANGILNDIFPTWDLSEVSAEQLVARPEDPGNDDNQDGSGGSSDDTSTGKDGNALAGDEGGGPGGATSSGDDTPLLLTSQNRRRLAGPFSFRRTLASKQGAASHWFQQRQAQQWRNGQSTGNWKSQRSLSFLRESSFVALIES